MNQSIRIQKKIIKYSFLFKLLGLIDEEEYNRIKDKYTAKSPYTYK